MNNIVSASSHVSQAPTGLSDESQTAQRIACLFDVGDFEGYGSGEAGRVREAFETMKRVSFLCRGLVTTLQECIESGEYKKPACARNLRTVFESLLGPRCADFAARARKLQARVFPDRMNLMLSDKDEAAVKLITPRIWGLYRFAVTTVQDKVLVDEIYRAADTTTASEEASPDRLEKKRPEWMAAIGNAWRLLWLGRSTIREVGIVCAGTIFGAAVFGAKLGSFLIAGAAFAAAGSIAMLVVWIWRQHTASRPIRHAAASPA